MKANNKKLLNVKELADFLNIKVSTLYSWVNQKKIPYVKIGHVVRFKREEIEKWLEDRSIKV